MTEPPWLLALVILLAFGIGFPLLWCSVVALASLLSGWRRLARSYECNRSLQGVRHTWAGARVGPVHYSAVLTFTVLDEGLGISVMPLFSAGHPDLLIPWDRIAFLKARRLIGRTRERESYHIDDSQGGSVRITIAGGIVPPEKVGRDSEKPARAGWPTSG